MGAEWPFVGRADELRQLRQWLTTGERQSVVLAGAPGVGKTRLALECLHAADDSGFATARVTATRAAAGIPFGALAPLLPAFHHEEAGAVDDRADLLRRSAAALVERAGGRRLVLFVDDAHLLDDASATLIHQLAVTGAASLLVTVRTGEATADPIVSLWKDGLAERIEVEGLDADAVEEVLTSALGGRVDRAAVAHLAVRCQGNVMFLRELVIGALHDGSLRDDGGIWRLAGRLAPSDRLVELVEGRLSGLSPAERDLLEVVSLGEPLGSAELLTLGDPSLAEILERKGILRSQTDERRLSVRLAHPIYGEVLRSRIPALRLRQIARSLAEAVEACGQRRREDTLRVATWRLDGGGARPDVMLAAATTARWRYDFALAERLARAALESGAGFDAAVLAAQLASLQGRGDEAEAQLAALAARAVDDAQRGLVAITRLDNRMIYAGTIEEGLQLVEQTESSVTDPGWRDEVTARRGALLLATSGPRTSAATLEPLLERADGRALVWACMPGAHSLGRLGRIDAALAAAARGREVQLTLTSPMDWYPWTHLFYRGEALSHAGRLKEAEALATAQYHEAVRDRSVEGQALFAGLLAKVLLDRGRVATAVDRGREAVALYRQLGRPQFEQVFLVYAAHGLALAGLAAEAAQALEAHDAMALPPTYFMGVDLELARAWTAVAGGDLPGAARRFDAAATRGSEIGDLVGAAAALHGLARLGRARDVLSRLADVAADIEGDLAPARAAHALALAEADAAELTGLSERFEAMGATLLAAEAAADAAVVWRRAEAPRDSAAAERRVAVLVAQCEGASTPALGAVEPRSRLTPAEREAALLAASGRSNRDIADELCVSVRTIENRLMHVYEKLGISGRAELAAALSGLGLAG